MRPIITPRLRLRPLVRTDLRALQSLYGDEEMMRYITGRPRTPWDTRARLKKDMRHHLEYGFGLCLGELRETGDAVGRFGIEPRPGPDGLEGELAWMVHRRFRGQGLATEAARALLSFVSDELGIRRVFATTHPDNAASIRVMGRLGLVQTATSRTDLTFEAPQNPPGAASPPP